MAAGATDETDDDLRGIGLRAGEFRAGFQSPVGVFGSGFAEKIADTRITLQASTDGTPDVLVGI